MRVRGPDMLTYCRDSMPWRGSEEASHPLTLPPGGAALLTSGHTNFKHLQTIFKSIVGHLWKPAFKEEVIAKKKKNHRGIFLYLTCSGVSFVDHLDLNRSLPCSDVMRDGCNQNATARVGPSAFPARQRALRQAVTCERPSSDVRGGESRLIMFDAAYVRHTGPMALSETRRSGSAHSNY